MASHLVSLVEMSRTDSLKEETCGWIKVVDVSYAPPTLLPIATSNRNDFQATNTVMSVCRGRPISTEAMMTGGNVRLR